MEEQPLHAQYESVAIELSKFEQRMKIDITATERVREQTKAELMDFIANVWRELLGKEKFGQALQSALLVYTTAEYEEEFMDADEKEAWSSAASIFKPGFVRLRYLARPPGPTFWSHPGQNYPCSLSLLALSSQSLPTRPLYASRSFRFEATMQGVMHTYSKSNEISNHDETLPIARRPAH